MQVCLRVAWWVSIAFLKTVHPNFELGRCTAGDLGTTVPRMRSFG